MDNKSTPNGDRCAVEAIEHFTGTTVPRKALFDHLAAGGSLKSFLARCPTVTPERAEAILVMAEMKRDEMAKAGTPAPNLFAAYLEAVNDSSADQEFLRSVQEYLDALHDPEAMRRISHKWGTIDGILAEMEEQTASKEPLPGAQR